MQALAVMEGEAGNVDAARELFERAVNEQPTHVHSWQARAPRKLLNTASHRSVLVEKLNRGPAAWC